MFVFGINSVYYDRSSTTIQWNTIVLHKVSLIFVFQVLGVFKNPHYDELCKDAKKDENKPKIRNMDILPGRIIRMLFLQY